MATKNYEQWRENEVGKHIDDFHDLERGKKFQATYSGDIHLRPKTPESAQKQIDNAIETHAWENARQAPPLKAPAVGKSPFSLFTKGQPESIADNNVPKPQPPSFEKK